MMGVWLKRHIVWGLAYILIWEGFIALGGRGVAQFAIRTYTRSIIVDRTGADLVGADFSAPTAILVPLDRCRGRPRARELAPQSPRRRLTGSGPASRLRPGLGSVPGRASGCGAGLAQDGVGETEALVGEPHHPAGRTGGLVVDQVAHHGERDVRRSTWC